MERQGWEPRRSALGPPAGRRTDIWEDEESSPSVREERSLELRTAPQDLWAEDDGETTRAPQVSRQPPQSVRRRWKRWVVLAMIVALLADGLYSFLTYRNSLRVAASQLGIGKARLNEGELTLARDAFESALAATSSANSLKSHPSTFVSHFLPIVGTDVRAVEKLTEAADLTAGAGLTATEGAMALGSDDTSIARRLYSEGRIDFDAIVQLRPYVADVVSKLATADAELANLQRPHLSSLRSGLALARLRISSAETAAKKAAATLASLPELLGDGGPKEYLLALESTSEARATGGLIGYIGILKADAGELSLGKISSIQRYERQLHGRVSAPQWFETQYEKFSATRQWRQTNLSPDFPSVARVLLNMYEAVEGKELDGVVAMDPTAMAKMMRATGPIDLGNGFTPRRARPETIERLLLHDSYLLDPLDQNELLERVIKEFWTRLTDDDARPTMLGRALSAAVASRHLKVFADRGAIQDHLELMGVSGSPAASGDNIQLVYNNNIGNNKVDFYLDEELETQIQLYAGGEAVVTTTARLHNAAPPGPKSVLLGGQGTPAEIGENMMALNFLMARDARPREYEIDGKKARPFQGRDNDYPRVWDTIFLKSGESTEVTLSYAIVDAFDPSAGRDFKFTLLPHPAVEPSKYSVEISPPKGYSLTHGSESETPPFAGSFVDSGRLTEPISYTVTLVKDE